MIGVDNKSAFCYLPLTVAERLGYFALEGLDVQVRDARSAGGGTATAVALLWANSPWASSYDALWNAPDETIIATAVADLADRYGPWPSVLGDISFDQKGDVTVPDYVFYIWRNGTYAELS